MCKLKSAIVLKSRIYIPNHDHHTKMLEELGIEDNRANAERLFVRVELSPEGGDMFSDIEGWKLNVDQDIRPDWFFEEVEKPKLVQAVKEWAKEHIFIGQHNLNFECKEDTALYFKDCKNVTVSVLGAATAKVYTCGSSTAKVITNGSSTVEVYTRDSSTAEVYTNGSSTAEVNTCGSSTAKVITNGSSTVEVYTYGSSTAKVITLDSSCTSIYERGENAAEIELHDNSTIRNMTTSTLHQCGDWKLVKVDD